MATDEKILTIAAAAWNTTAAALLGNTIRGAPCYTVEDLRAEVLAGGSQLYSVTDDAGELVGYVVLRVELYAGGAEGVIVAGAGRLMGAKLYRQVVPALERMFTGVKTYRVESCRRAGNLELEDLGYLPTHVVYRKAAPLELRGDDKLEALAECATETAGGPDLRARPGKPHGGGKSSSSSSSSQQTYNTDRRIVADNEGIGINADGSVTVNRTTTDLGAIAGALELARSSSLETIGLTRDLFSSGLTVLDKAGKQIEAQTALVAKAYDNAKGEGTQKNLVAAAAIAAVVIVAVRVWK